MTNKKAGASTQELKAFTVKYNRAGKMTSCSVLASSQKEANFLFGKNYKIPFSELELTATVTEPFKEIFDTELRDEIGRLLATVNGKDKELITLFQQAPKMLKALRFAKSVLINGGCYERSEQLAVEEIEAAIKDLPE